MMISHSRKLPSIPLALEPMEDFHLVNNSEDLTVLPISIMVFVITFISQIPISI